MEKEIRPLGKLVLVEFEKSESETKSGIIIPELAHIDLQHRNAVVIEVGTKVKDLRKGNRVVVKSYGTLKRIGNSQALYNEEDVLAIID